MSTSVEPPHMELLEYAAFTDPGSFFDPLVVSAPGSGVAVEPALIEAHRDEFWYINIASDALFEYRSVEIPFAIANVCPNRNLTQSECRSVGITQSAGWENFYRDSNEKNVFMFRRPLSVAQQEALATKTRQEIASGLEWALKATDNVVSSYIIFPMSVFDSEYAQAAIQAVFGSADEISVTSMEQLMELQSRIFRTALATQTPPTHPN